MLNMNYGKLIYNKVNKNIFETFRFVEVLDLLKYICVFWCVLYYTFLFLMRLSFCVCFSVYRKIVQRCFLHF